MSDQLPPNDQPERGGDLKRLSADDMRRSLIRRPIPSTQPTSQNASQHRSHATLRRLECQCEGAGAMLMPEAAARAARLIPLDVYGDRWLVPCECTDGRKRAEKWRNLPREADGVTLDSGRLLPSQTAAAAAIRMFIADPYGWLTLHGGYGVGKTRMIYAALNHLAENGVYGRYVMMPDLLNELRDAISRKDDYSEKLRRFAQAPLLAIDELDKLRDGDFVNDVLYAIFLARYAQRDTLATIIGYNADGVDRIPPFIRSRMSDSRFVLIDLGGRDLRPIADQLDPWDRGPEEGER